MLDVYIASCTASALVSYSEITMIACFPFLVKHDHD